MQGGLIGALFLPELIILFTVLLVVKGKIVPFVILGLVRICFHG